MAWFRRRKDPGGDRDRDAYRADVEHLEQFAQSRYGVEAYLEPKTAVTETTVVFIAHDGEWTRRRVESAEAAHQLGHRLGIPVYDVGLVGYPNRMREYNARQRRAES